MGAWSETGFGNDVAMDFADGVAKVGDLERALTSDDRFYDADAASEAVAAAEIITACLGRAAYDLPDGIKGKLGDFGTPSEALIAQATSVVSQVSKTSELAELWAEAEDAGWKAAIDDLLARLDMATPYEAPPPPKPVAAGSIGAACCLCGEDIAEAEEITLTVEDEYSSMTMYGHPHCLENTFKPPHFNADNTPTPELLAQIAETI